jgi:predicted RNase H-like HicB family nuclease
LYDNEIVQSHVFRVVIEEDRFEDGSPAYHAFCPALKGCHTWGHSPEEALANIREAAELYVEDLIDAGDPIPDNPQDGTIVIPAPAVVVSR